MPKTHQQLIEEFEIRLLAALIDRNKESLAHLMHPDFVFTDEAGIVYRGMRNLALLKTPLVIHTIDVTERTVSLFNNVAVVNSFEKRTGTFSDLLYDREYRFTRVWKFNGKKWQLIAATVVSL